jgi:hypothetical protein
MKNLAALPFPLVESNPNSWQLDELGGTLIAKALPQSDLYINPKGAGAADAPSTLNALTLLGTPPVGDYQFSAKVMVGFNASYDAGALLIWSSNQRWAKLCFEFSPDMESMVVSVVTMGASDDANSFTTPTHWVWLRVSKIDHSYAFHASVDARSWKLIRVFTLGKESDDLKIGFVAQAPVGNGCEVSFSDIHFTSTRLLELRDGS